MATVSVSPNVRKGLFKLSMERYASPRTGIVMASGPV